MAYLTRSTLDKLAHQAHTHSMTETRTYRVDYSEVKPGGTVVQQSDRVSGTLDDVRALLDSRYLTSYDDVTVTESVKSDGIGRVIDRDEWDV